MKIKLLLSFVFLTLILVLIHCRYVIITDDRLLQAMRSIKRGMTIDELSNIIGSDTSQILHDFNSLNNDEKYIIRKYMGYVTSRNLVIILDGSKKVSFVSWENT